MKNKQIKNQKIQRTIRQEKLVNNADSFVIAMAKCIEFYTYANNTTNEDFVDSLQQILRSFFTVTAQKK